MRGEEILAREKLKKEEEKKSFEIMKKKKKKTRSSVGCWKGGGKQ